MRGEWLAANRFFSLRDLVRDYCAVFRVLAEQRRRFERDGSVSYAVLGDLLGEAGSKGIFWRLKDASRQLFRTEKALGQGENDDCAGMLIDWCVGYAFHECCKLREDAFQSRHYANRLAQLTRLPGWKSAGEPLGGLTAQTAESISRELGRIMRVLSHGLALLPRALAAEGENPPLARWLVCEESLARAVFGLLFADLVTAVCGGGQGRLHALAARDFLRAGRWQTARALLAQAGDMGALDDEGEALLAELGGMPDDGEPRPCAQGLSTAGEAS